MQFLSLPSRSGRFHWLRIVFITVLQSTFLFALVGCAWSPDPAVKQALQRATATPEYVKGIDAAMTNAISGKPDPKTDIPVVTKYFQSGVSDDDRQKLRNEAMHDWLYLDDQDFQNYVLVFGYQQRFATMSGDILTLMLDTAATLTHGDQAKTVLAGLAAISVGTRIAFDKDIFYQNTFPALVKQMQQMRIQKRAAIETKLATYSDATYPLSTAVGDLRDYEMLGTLTGILPTLGNATSPPSTDTALDQWAKTLAGITLKLTGTSTFKVESAAWDSGHTTLTLTGTKTPASGADMPSDASIKTALDASADAASPDVRARLQAATVTTAAPKSSTSASQPATQP